MIQAEIQRAKADFIPSGGPSVRCDFYVDDPRRPGSTKRAEVPMEALIFLIKRLEHQGHSQKNLDRIGNQGAVSDIARMTSQMGQPMQEVLPTAI